MDRARADEDQSHLRITMALSLFFNLLIRTFGNKALNWMLLLDMAVNLPDNLSNQISLSKAIISGPY